MKIGIIGLGLIGGSLALELSHQGFHTVGVSRRQQTCDIALKNNIVRESGLNLEILTKTDLIFVCTPIKAILSTIKPLIEYLPPSTIITDVASVKGEIVPQATELWSNFVGSHPMAGNENQGIEYATLGLFCQAPCVITPIEKTLPHNIKIVQEIWEKLGCQIYQATPKQHDQAVAWISHLPVIISANLIYSCVNEENQEIISLAEKIASSGFRDTSRVGGGNPELGLMMAQYNRQELLHCLTQYRQNLDLIINQIEQNNWKNLRDILHITKDCRNKFLKALLQ